MTFPTGKLPSNQTRAFTLIELILVMALFVIVFGIVGPSLRGFFEGRDLDNEAQRFVALTRFGQSRAISEGVPVQLWIDSKEGRYGLEALSGYAEKLTNPIVYTVATRVQISASTPGTTLTHSNYWTQTKPSIDGFPTIRFQPDGRISDTSPAKIYLKQSDNGQICVAENSTHLRYEIKPGETEPVKK